LTKQQRSDTIFELVKQRAKQIMNIEN